jgi:hypothetical protein
MKAYSRVILMTAVLLTGMALWLPGLRSRRVAAQNPGLKGSYGFTVLRHYAGGDSAPVAVVGVMTFDGAGNATGSETVVFSDPAPDATTVQAQTFPFTGTYVVNADGTGTITLQIPGQTIPVAFVLADGGSTVMFVQSGATNDVITGTARKQ